MLRLGPQRILLAKMQKILNFFLIKIYERVPCLPLWSPYLPYVNSLATYPTTRSANKVIFQSDFPRLNKL